jgi:hypothetical protein
MLKRLFLLFFFFVAVHFSFFSVAHSAESLSLKQQNCPNTAHKLPFASFVRGNATGEAILNAEGYVQALEFGEKRISFPEDVVPLSVVTPQNKASLAFGRHHITGHLAILAEREGKYVKLELPQNEKMQFYFQHALTLDDRIILIVYDVVTNSPSGRRINRVSEGLDFYEVIISGDAVEFKRFSQISNLGGFDVTILDASVKDGKLVCSQTGCVRLSSPVLATDDLLVTPLAGQGTDYPHKQLLEIASDGQNAFGLYQGDYEDRVAPIPSAATSHFSVCPLEKAGLCQMLPASVIPYRLRVSQGKPAFETLTKRRDVAKLIEYDLSRIRGSGVSHWAENNLEGRIAWGSTYYINGLTSLLKETTLLRPLLKQKTIDRLCTETSHIAHLAKTFYPWLYSKRYSLEREPIASIVHLGRMARLLKRAQSVIDNPHLSSAVASISQELVSLSRVIEEIKWGDNGARTEVRIRKYVSFWSDGTNVPWNYVSSWIEGGLSTNVFAKGTTLYGAVERIAQLFVENEKINSLPQSWNYASGDFTEGWNASQGISANTPSYKGNKTNTQTAHISYRSMDAMAMLALKRSGSSVITDTHAAHFKTLVETGWLYPFVAEQLVDSQIKVDIPPHIARIYARSVLAWQVQNQPWALEALARTLPP